MESLSCSSEEAVCHLASLIFWPTQCLTHFGSATPHLELVKSTFYETSAAAYFLTIKASQKKEKESADAVELSSWISGKVFFFFPLPFIILLTAFLIPIKPILHSCLSFIELAGDIFSTGWPWETVLSKFHKFQEWSIQIFLNMRDT